MADFYVALKTDEVQTPVGVGRSIPDLERRLGLPHRTLEYCFYKNIPNKRLQMTVRRVTV